jgi:hypothetical protein
MENSLGCCFMGRYKGNPGARDQLSLKYRKLIELLLSPKNGAGYRKWPIMLLYKTVTIFDN